MIQLIAGSIIGESVYTQIYDDLGKEEDNLDTVFSSDKKRKKNFLVRNSTLLMKSFVAPSCWGLYVIARTQAHN